MDFKKNIYNIFDSMVYDRSYYEIVSDFFEMSAIAIRNAVDFDCVGWSEIDRIQATGISNSQQYKLAGNSIVVAVLANIFRKVFINRESETQQRELF